MHPVAQPPLGGARPRPLRPLDRGGEVVDLARDRRPDLALVDPLRELDVGRGVPDLEADGQAQLALRALAELDDLPGAGHVDRHRLLEVDVLAGGDRRLEVQRMEPGRRRDVERVDVLAREERLVGVQALEEPRGVDRGLAELGRDLVEALLAGFELVRERVADRREHGVRVLQERAHHAAAAAAAAEQPQAHGRVRLAAEGDPRLQDRHASRRHAHAHELSPADSRTTGLCHDPRSRVSCGDSESPGIARCQ